MGDLKNSTGYLFVLNDSATPDQTYA